MSEEPQNEWKEAVEINFPVADFPLCSFCHVTEESKSDDRNYWSRKIKENLMLLEAEKPFREEHQVSLTDIMERRKHLYFVHVFPFQYKESKYVTDFEDDYVDQKSYQWYCVDLEVDWPDEEKLQKGDIPFQKTRYILGHYKILNKDLFAFDPVPFQLGISFHITKSDHTAVNISPETIKKKQLGHNRQHVLRAVEDQTRETVTRLLNDAAHHEEKTAHYLHLPKCTEDDEGWGFYYSAIVFYLNPLLEKFLEGTGRLPDALFKIRVSLVRKPDDYFSLIKRKKVFADDADVRKIDEHLVIPDTISVLNDNPWKTGLVAFPGAVGLMDETSVSPRTADLINQSTIKELIPVNDSFAEKANITEGEVTELYAGEERGMLIRKDSLSDWLCSYDKVPESGACVGKGVVQGSCSVPLLTFGEPFRIKDSLQWNEWSSFDAIEPESRVKADDCYYGELKPENISHLLAVAPTWEGKQGQGEYQTSLELHLGQSVLSDGRITNASHWNKTKISLKGCTFSPIDDVKLAVQYQRPVLIPIRYTGSSSDHPIDLDSLTLSIQAEYQEIYGDYSTTKTYKDQTLKSAVFVCRMVLDASIKQELRTGKDVWIAVYLHGLMKQLPDAAPQYSSLSSIRREYKDMVFILQEHFTWGEKKQLFNADIGFLSVPYTFSAPQFMELLPDRGLLPDNPIVVRTDIQSYGILLQKRTSIQKQIRLKEIQTGLDLTLGLLGLVPGISSVAQVMHAGSTLIVGLMAPNNRIKAASSFIKCCEVLSGVVVAEMEQLKSDARVDTFLSAMLKKKKKLWIDQMEERLKMAKGSFKLAGILTQCMDNINQLHNLYRELDKLHSFPTGYQDEAFGADEHSDMDSLLLVMMGWKSWDPETMEWCSSPEDLALPVLLRVRNTSRRFLGKEIASTPLPLSEHFGKILEMDRLGDYMERYVNDVKNLNKEQFREDLIIRYPELDEDAMEDILSMLSGEGDKFFTVCPDSSCDTILEDWVDICPNSMDHAGWKEEGLLNAVLEEMFNFEGYSNKFVGKIAEIKRKNIEEKMRFIKENASLELLTVGWGQEIDDSTQKKVWRFVDDNYVGEKRYLIYKKGNS